MDIPIEPIVAAFKKEGIPFRMHESTLSLSELREVSPVAWNGVQTNMIGRNTTVEMVVLYEFFTVRGREAEMGNSYDRSLAGGTVTPE